MKTKPILLTLLLVVVAAGAIAIGVAFLGGPSGPPGGRVEVAGRDAPVSQAPVVVSISSITAPTTNETNAVNCYRQAAEQFLPLRQDPRFSALVNRYTEGGFDSNTPAFFEQCLPILLAIKQGTALSNCDWGDPTQPASPSLGDVRALNRLLIIHAKYALRGGELPIALDDAITGMTFSRQVAQDQILIGLLVGTVGEIEAGDVVAEALPKLSHEQLQSLAQRIDALPPAVTGPQLTDGEYRYAVRIAEKQGLIQIAFVNGMEGFYKDAGVAMDKGPTELAQVVNRYTNELKLNPLIKQRGISMLRAQESIGRGRQRRVLLRAAVDVALEGPAAAQRYHSIYGDSPVHYNETARGFDLSINDASSDAPVTLSVPPQS